MTTCCSSYQLNVFLFSVSAIDCPLLIILSGAANTSQVSFPAIVRVTCDVGFVLSTDATRWFTVIQCTAEASWSPHPENCTL